MARLQYYTRYLTRQDSRRQVGHSAPGAYMGTAGRGDGMVTVDMCSAQASLARLPALPVQAETRRMHEMMDRSAAGDGRSGGGGFPTDTTPTGDPQIWQLKCWPVFVPPARPQRLFLRWEACRLPSAGETPCPASAMFASSLLGLQPCSIGAAAG